MPSRRSVDGAARTRFAVDVLRDQQIPVGDEGAQLAADVYLPREAPPAPALITLLPYLKDGFAGILGHAAHHAFAAAGYPSVLVDLRGLGGSSGAVRPPFDPGEADDGVAAVEWAARQPWCSGRVGMWGASYGAMTALRTAARRPPALGAVVAIVGATDQEHDFVHPHGVRGGLSSIGVWGLLTFAQQLWPPLHQDADGRWLERWQQRLETAEPWVIDLVRHGPDDPVWRSRALDVSGIEAPTFCVGGWRDLFCEGTLRMYEQVAAPKRLLMGPWGHTLPEESPIAPVDFVAMALRWWDRWLGEDDNGIDEEPAVTFHLQRRATWHEAEHWPPAEPAVTTLHPHADGALAEREGDGEMSRAIDVTAGAAAALWGGAVPDDQHDDDLRSLAFTSAPLVEPLTIVGRPRLTLALDLEPRVSRTLVPKLADVDPDGRSVLITSGTVALAEDASDAGPVELGLYATSYEVAVGHRLRLVVAASDFPRLWPDPHPGRLTVRCRGTALVLPTASLSDPVELPAAASTLASPLVRRAEPVHVVGRDRATGTVRVDLGERIAATTPDGLSELDHDQLVSIGVRPDRPDAASMTGTSTATIRGPHGEIVVTAEIVVRGPEATASGTVRWDGRELLSRRWRT